MKLFFLMNLSMGLPLTFKKNHYLFTILILSCLFTSQLHAFKTPFHPSDVLPLLPRQVSWPILKYLSKAEDILPTFVGAAIEGNNSFSWKGACFYKNSAWLEFHNKTGSEFGGGTLHIKGEDVIAILPWDEWWNFELTKDDSSPHIAILPLRSELRAKFNNAAAWEYARSMSGLPYGYHNLVFAWIDTIDGNYPPPLDAHVVASVMTIWNQMQPEYAANLWKEALNKRLGTKGLDLPEVLVEVEKRGSSFGELLAIPEQDDWVYSDGKSTSCIAFVLEIYKAAGLFGPLASSIEVTEFTIKDAYILNFFESNSSLLPKWCNDGDPVKLPFCQILGKYRMELPDYNTMDPYAHMNERTVCGCRFVAIAASNFRLIFKSIVSAIRGKL